MDKLLFRRILVTVLSVLAIIYAVYLLLSANFKMVATENAVKVTVTNTIYSDGFIIRDESFVNNNSSGVLSYSLNDGEAVKVGGEIAKVYSNEADAAARTKADNLEKQMYNLQETQKRYASNSIGIDTINNGINNEILEFYNDVNKNEVQLFSGDMSSLVASINLRQIYTNKSSDFNTEIADLSSQITQLRASSGDSIGTITSEKAGYFSAHCDGFENAIKYTDVDKIKLEDLKNIKKSSVNSNVAGKVISSLGWYVACKVTADEATSLSLWDGNATVLLKNAYSESIPATIVRIHQETKDSDAILVLKCNYMNSDLIEARIEPIEVGLGTYTGLRISKKAIHDDYVTNTTYDENDNKHEEQKKVQGVYVLYGNEVQFKQISILYADEDYVICDETPDSSQLFNGETISLYDKVIVEGDNLYDGKVVK